MLKIEDVKAGDKLECIDRDGYVNQDNGYGRIRKQILKGPIVVFEITKNGVSLTRSGLQIPLDSLKYFKKKEQSQQYTFDDLIDVATKAFKDRAIFSVGITICAVSIKLHDKSEEVFTIADIDEGIEFIQSLYKETFVIECEEDIKRIKVDSTITLANGNIIKVKELCRYGVEYSNLSIVYRDENYHVIIHTILELKGATVEQERGRDD
ncbi:hypothetical protein [Wohlfahrtiimonas populi]|uniref:hypothetical protein n=1 Tax=Wohlfahrtiimonas populi TaxID=1940240 RepID=UPI00098CF538|nr:hypothetical protein [Wohlfahrtiimonas populi]